MLLSFDYAPRVARAIRSLDCSVQLAGRFLQGQLQAVRAPRPPHAKRFAGNFGLVFAQVDKFKHSEEAYLQEAATIIFKRWGPPARIHLPMRPKW